MQYFNGHSMSSASAAITTTLLHFIHPWHVEVWIGSHRVMYSRQWLVHWQIVLSRVQMKLWFASAKLLHLCIVSAKIFVLLLVLLVHCYLHSTHSIVVGAMVIEILAANLHLDGYIIFGRHHDDAIYVKENAHSTTPSLKNETNDFTPF